MMGLRPFGLEQPTHLDEAVALLADAGSEGRALAGGTDLLVNLKHRLHQPKLLVSLSEIDRLRGIRVENGALHIGAGETLTDVAAHPLVREHAPALAQACERVAHPQARVMGTLGGNVCLDVRCQYINQTEAWREALGGCFKDGNDECHVVPGGSRCVAALSGDSIAPLVAYGAELEVVGPEGERTMTVATLRTKDGCSPLDLEPADIVTTIRVPLATGKRRSQYVKWAVRQAVDFPLVSIGIVCDQSPDGSVASLRVVVGALGPRPRLVSGLERFEGQRLGPTLIKEITDRVVKQCAPLPNVLYEAPYRRRLLGILVRRSLQAWV